MTKQESEFGSGTTYCLGLFLAHQAMAWKMKQEYTSMDSIALSQEMKDQREKLGIKDYKMADRWAAMWFNGASDHLYELQIPKKLPKSLQARLKKFQNKVLNFGHGMGLMNDEKVKEKDVWDSLDEAKLLLRKIDEAMLGIKTIKGSWE